MCKIYFKKSRKLRIFYGREKIKKFKCSWREIIINFVIWFGGEGRWRDDEKRKEEDGGDRLDGGGGYGCGLEGMNENDFS